MTPDTHPDIANITRRNMLFATLGAGVAASIITPDQALAGATPAGWALGVADVEADIPLANLDRISGRLPTGFGGTLYRNGPAKFRRPGGDGGHWFDGDGLIRRFHLADGKATLNARFADTPKRRLEAKLNAIVQPGFGTPERAGSVVMGPDDCNSANTSILGVGNEIWALWEGGSPVRMDARTLETLGMKTFRRDLKSMPFLAHPRVEPDGTVWNLGGGGKKGAVWKVNRDGSLAAFQMIDLPRPSYFHDFTATARHIIIVLQPWLQEGFKFPLSTAMAWRPEQGTQILVLDKADLTQRRIFELPAFSFFHLGDAWEEADGTIRFDGAFEADPTFGQTAASALLRGEYIKSPPPILTQVVLRPDGSAETLATGVRAEFPANDKRRAGVARRHTTHVTGYRQTPFPHAIATWDWEKGRDDAHDFGDHQLVEEFLFVPKGSSAHGGERDGWLVGTTLNLKAKATELHVMDAAHVSHGPIASFRTAMALPIGFHGAYVSA